MKRLVTISLNVFICVCLLIATERQAWAYVDPGSGLLALQSAASVAAACGYFLRRRIRSLFAPAGVPTKAAMPVTVAAKEGNAVKAA